MLEIATVWGNTSSMGHMLFILMANSEGGQSFFKHLLFYFLSWVPGNNPGPPVQRLAWL